MGLLIGSRNEWDGGRQPLAEPAGRRQAHPHLPFIRRVRWRRTIHSAKKVGNVSASELATYIRRKRQAAADARTMTGLLIGASGVGYILNWPDGVEREILSSSSFMSTETSANSGVLR